MALTLAFAGLVLAAFAVVGALVLGWADRVFAVEVDPRLASIEAALPGSNCGGCGHVGCAEYARAVAEGGAALTLCGPGGATAAREIARVMGVELGEHLPYRAVVHCSADWEMRLQRSDYRGEPTCAAANLLGGVQGCTYGCLGLADCERACPYDAIHVIDGLARVDYEKCVGCKRCAAVCPRKIISMVPFRSERVLVVACSNEDFGPEVKRVCTVGCIGCRSCFKLAGGAMAMPGHLPRIDYDNAWEAVDADALIEKCPMESLIYVGKPSDAEREAVAGERPEGPVKARFETTVDRTEWWG